jgi:hypothetical protein
MGLEGERGKSLRSFNFLRKVFESFADIKVPRHGSVEGPAPQVVRRVGIREPEMMSNRMSNAG